MSFLLILIAALLFGALRGCLQGMIMIQPGDKMAADPAAERSLLGVRNHHWFGIFHRLWIYCLIVFAELVTLWTMHFPDTIGMPLLRYCEFSIGCFLLGWEAAEMMCPFARYCRWICGRENIVIADLVSWHPERVWSYLVHGFRIGAGGMLFIGAMLF